MDTDQSTVNLGNATIGSSVKHIWLLASIKLGELGQFLNHLRYYYLSLNFRTKKTSIVLNLFPDEYHICLSMHTNMRPMSYSPLL